MPEFRDEHHAAAAFLAVITARNERQGFGQALAEALRASDAVRVRGAFPPEQVAALRTAAERAHADGRFAAARMGRAREARESMRGDELCWLDQLRDAPSCALLAELEALRLTLDHALLLGTRSVEAHYARYAPGTHYARHLDRVSEDAAADGGRVLSLALYLNPDWTEADGGALRLYDGTGQAHDVPPLGGDLVVFLSDRVAHEVLPATTARWSIAAWLSRAASATL